MHKLKRQAIVQVDFSALEDVQQQLADAEEEAEAIKAQCAAAADTAAQAVATRDLQLERAATGKLLVVVLTDVISELERLHNLQDSVRDHHTVLVATSLNCLWGHTWPSVAY
jgi:hypothetical protein